MDKSSVTRPSPPSTLAIVADGAFCAQVAAVLMGDEEPVRQAFIGEPVEEILAMVRWALSHEDDEGFDTVKVLTDWAQNASSATMARVEGREGRVTLDSSIRLTPYGPCPGVLPTPPGLLLFLCP